MSVDEEHKVTISLGELSQLLRAVQVPKVPKSGTLHPFLTSLPDHLANLSLSLPVAFVLVAFVLLVEGLGNPGPLGLGAFALTTMTLSIYNAGILTDTSGLVVAVALFYGGIAQFIAGTHPSSSSSSTLHSSGRQCSSL